MKSTFCYLIFVCLVSSCTSYRFVDIQILHPAKTELISPQSTLHIIAPEEFKNKPYTIAITDSTLSTDEYLNKFMNHFDSVLVLYLQESPVFQHSEIQVQDEDTFLKETKSLSAAERKSHFQLNIQKLLLTDTIPPPEFEEYDYNYAYAGTYSLAYHIELNLVSIGNPMITFSYPMNDTLIWTGKGDFPAEVDRRLPNTVQAIEETAEIIARDYAHVIAPYWYTDSRILLFTNNKYLRTGYKHFIVNNPDSAIKTWKYLYENGTDRLSAIAAYNIGLVYETLDNLNNCELWLNKSLKARHYNETQQYLQEIKRRKTLRVKLDKQLK